MAAIDTACLADGVANQLFTSLTSDAPTPPTVDLSGPLYTFTPDATSALYADINAVTLEELTEKDLAGDGVFDTLMASVDLHIQREFKGNRITGDQYAEVYTQVMTAVLGQSVSFLLQKDQAKWSAIKAQMDARIAEIAATEALINLERTKVETQKAIFDMQNSGAEYALTKMKLANADIEYCLTEAQRDSEVYKRNWLLPAELSLQEYQRNNMMPIEYAAKQVTADRLLPAQASIAEFENRVLQPIQEGTANFNLQQTLVTQQAAADYQLNNLLPVQLGKEQHLLNFQLPAQTNLLNEQKETARANTLDVRSDALTPITGSVGKQKDLYTQQIDSFVKDSQYKTGKMYLDGWITQKTLDENLAAPVELGVTSVSAVLASLRSNNAL